MKTIKPLTAIILIVMLFTLTVYAEKWYEGGTLHNATTQEWRQASYENRLATCSIFVVATSEGGKLAMEKGMDAIKMMAVDLERCISEASEDTDKVNLKVNELAAMCFVPNRQK